MKELFNHFEHISLDKAKKYILLDTCFIWHILETPKVMKKIKGYKNLAVTSFNVEELVYTKKKVKSSDKKALRDFLKKEKFIIVDIPVFPGQVRKEKSFVNSVDSEILKHCEDPSDAVLIAVAVKTKSDIFTRDKHHLFTAELENYLMEKEVEVFN